MGVMDIIRKWKERNAEKSEKFKEMQENDRLQTMLEERKKSSDRRELERYYKEQEEKQIKAQLESIRKQQTKESWKGKNMFGGKATMLKEDKKILTNDRPILLQKSIFLDNKTQTPLTKQEMFFKW